MTGEPVRGVRKYFRARLCVRVSARVVCLPRASSLEVRLAARGADFFVFVGTRYPFCLGVIVQGPCSGAVRGWNERYVLVNHLLSWGSERFQKGRLHVAVYVYKLRRGVDGARELERSEEPAWVAWVQMHLTRL